MTKKDSLGPEIYGVASVFFLSFNNLVNLITLVQLIKLNRNFFERNLSEVLVDFFTDYEISIKITLGLLIILNNILLYNQAKKIEITYDKFKSSFYFFSYLIISMLCWLIVMLETTLN